MTVRDFITAAVSLCLSSIAMAAPERMVVAGRDSRQSAVYTTLYVDDGVCRRARDPDHPRKGDCKEKREKVAVADEEITCDAGVCVRRSYSGRSDSMYHAGRGTRAVSFPLPTVPTVVRTYTCDAQGAEISNR